ncbi:hypothetical protein F5X68DRAFT_4909 [Plectosphaerella plurivora]|uniref:Uncharacterized protein n=1 Tax=Plectosphaerella plurivora TaxID=936078 RepID=A0A9P9AFU9_9PEZI|nr:hypothetical protein F5X68DRAFT_4909 [Plectosphaerella plurivora]
MTGGGVAAHPSQQHGSMRASHRGRSARCRLSRRAPRPKGRGVSQTTGVRRGVWDVGLAAGPCHFTMSRWGLEVRRRELVVEEESRAKHQTLAAAPWPGPNPSQLASDYGVADIAAPSAERDMISRCDEDRGCGGATRPCKRDEGRRVCLLAALSSLGRVVHSSTRTRADEWERKGGRKVDDARSKTREESFGFVGIQASARWVPWARWKIDFGFHPTPTLPTKRDRLPFPRHTDKLTTVASRMHGSERGRRHHMADGGAKQP